MKTEIDKTITNDQILLKTLRKRQIFKIRDTRSEQDRHRITPEVDTFSEYTKTENEINEAYHTLLAAASKTQTRVRIETPTSVFEMCLLK